MYILFLAIITELLLCKENESIPSQVIHCIEDVSVQGGAGERRIDRPVIVPICR